ELEDHFGARVLPSGPDAAQLAGFDSERDFRNLRRMENHARFGNSAVINVDPGKNPVQRKAEFGFTRPRVGKTQIEGREAAFGGMNSPLVPSPVDDSRWILSFD